MSHDSCECGHVVCTSAEEVHDGLVAETSGPDGEGVSLIVLFVGMIDDILDVGGPLVVFVNGHLSSGEEDSIDFAEDVV